MSPQAIAATLLDFHRDPVASRDNLAGPASLLDTLDLVVRLALGRGSEALAATPREQEELAQAALYYIGRTLFRERATHYQVLGLTPAATSRKVRDHYRLLIQVVHPDRAGIGGAWSDDIAARVNRAYSTLRHAHSRDAYDATLAADAIAQGAPPQSQPQSQPGMRRRVRLRPQPAPLPEWFTRDVLGFVRGHPGTTIFSVLTVAAVITVGRAVWPDADGELMRDAALLHTGTPVVPGPVIDGVQLPVLTVAGASVPDTSKGVEGWVDVAPAGIPSGSTKGQASSDARPPVATAPARAPGGSPPSLSVVPVPAASSAKGPSIVPPRVLPAAAPMPVATPIQVARVQSSDVAPRVSASAATAGPVPIAASTPPNAATAAAIAPTTAPTNSPASTWAAGVTAPASPPMSAIAAPVAATEGASDLLAARSLQAARIVERPGEASAPPGAADVEVVMSALISGYESGNLDSVVSLFDGDARTNEFRGRAAIRADYGELFGRSKWRTMKLNQLRWKSAGERIDVRGEVVVRIGWRDGREIEQRYLFDMELVRRGERTLIARLVHQERN